MNRKIQQQKVQMFNTNIFYSTENVVNQPETEINSSISFSVIIFVVFMKMPS